MSLNGKHIVLGVTGGIAAYKSVSLLRLFVKAGAEVQVVMTEAAKEFVRPLTFATLSRRPVISEFFTANTGEWHSHVDLGLWADAFVVAPATASTIGKMANGIADNMLVTSYLSTRGKVFVAPAMDLDMMSHPSTVVNIEKLRSFGATIIMPAEGELASGLVGKGRMEEPEKIFEAVDYRIGTDTRDLTGMRILVTAGPTIERIDPVRYIGNFSSGKMGYAIAENAALRGADVTLVSGPVSITTSVEGITVKKVESAEEMEKECVSIFPDVDVAILSAAVADYRPKNYSDTKIKRETTGDFELELVENPDIAKRLGEMKRDPQMLIGFALETNNEEENARRKLREKNLNFIVLNSMRDEGACFGTDTNKVKILGKVGTIDVIKDLPLLSKKEVAEEINNIVSLYYDWKE